MMSTGDGGIVAGRDAIGNTVNNYYGDTSRSPGTPKRHTLPPYIPLYGRKETLRDLENAFAAHHRVALWGAGGLGKSSVAAAFGYRVVARDAESKVLFVNASTQTLRSAMAGLAVPLALLVGTTANEDERLHAVHAWLQRNTNWRLILDNVENAEDLIPYAGNWPTGKVLLTSAQRMDVAAFGFQALELHPLTTQASTEFLHGRGKRAATPTEAPAAQALVQELGGLPLALEQAASYIAAQQISFADYWSRYQQHGGLKQLEKSKNPPGYPHTVATTWTLSMEAVEKKSPAAAALLRASAWLAPTPIPEALFLEDALSPHEVALAKVLRDAATRQEALGDALTLLAEYALVRRFRETDLPTWQLHRVVAMVVRHGSAEDDKTQGLFALTGALGAAIPGDYTNWAYGDLLIPHVWYVVITHLKPQNCCTEEAVIHLILLLQQAGDFLHSHGQYQQAKILYLMLLTVCWSLAQGLSLDVATIHNKLGLISEKLGQYRESISRHKIALTIRQTLLGKVHIEVEQSLNNLGVAYECRGGHDKKAECLYRRALSMALQRDPIDEIQTANYHNNLGTVYTSQQRYQEAEAALRKALIIRRAQEPQNEKTAQTLGILGIVLTYLGESRYQEAEQFHQEAIAMTKAVQRPGHPGIAIRLNGLGFLYDHQENYAKAEQQYRESLEIYEKSTGHMHPHYSETLGNLAGTIARQGRYIEAETHFLEAISIAWQTLGDTHPHTQGLLKSYGACIQMAFAAGQADSLSPHPQTQDILRQLREQDGGG